MTDDGSKDNTKADGNAVTRRRALQVFGVATGAAISGGLLAACGGGSGGPGTVTPQKGSAVSNAALKAGGTLRVGVTGGSPTANLDPALAQSDAALARAFNLYDPLCGRNAQYELEMCLAESIEPVPGKKATEWTIKLRDGVVFHNGKKLSADDVLFTWNRILDPAFANAAVGRIKTVDMKKTRKVNDLEIHVVLTQANADWPDNLGGSFTRIVPVGFDPKNPIGTGPFKYKSFTPGQRSMFVANKNYWRSGQPHVDALEIIDFADDTARVNALIGGQVEAITNLPTAQIASINGNPATKTLIAKTGNWQPLTMRVDKAPFNDPRVRQAFRLIVDRQQVVDQAYGGQASVANDLYARWEDLGANPFPQRTQDIERAKSLLKAAGQSDLRITLNTSPIFVGVVETAQVFAQQAKAAGVTVNVKKTDPSTFYGPQYLKYAFAQDYWLSALFLSQTAQSMLPSSPINETHWDNPKFTKLYQQAGAEVDSAKRREIIIEAQKILYDDGGFIIPAFSNAVDAYSAKVSGFQPSKYGGPLGDYGFAVAGFLAS